MIKLISVSKLRIGMYICDLRGTWVNHIFPLNEFKIDNISKIKTITDAGISQVKIDLSKGVDVLSSNQSLSEEIESVVYDVPILTPSDKTVEAVKIFNAANDIITDVMNDVKMGNQIELPKISPVIKGMCKTILRDSNALLGLSKIRQSDKYTFEHSVSVAILIMTFAKNLKMEVDIIEALGIAGFLHDIGKINTPNSILHKKGKLTEKEFSRIKEHVFDSYKILESIVGLSEITLNTVYQHHERFDGSGYPHGLKGDEICIYGQMAAIVDVYDALTSDRCYHKRREPHIVLGMLHKWSGCNFNPLLVQKFIQTVGIYPVGSLVLLNNNQVAKILTVGKNLLKPKVEIFIDMKTAKHIEPIIIDLEKDLRLKIIKAASFGALNLIV